jgi:[protein-PII] uridylyltransferase
MDAAAAGSLIERLRAGIAALAAQEDAAFRGGVPVAELLVLRTHHFDASLRELWQALAGEHAALALFAVGGYGRGELFPQSDLDVLVLCAAEPGVRERQAIEQFVSALWDVGLRPGHSVRTAAQCTQAAADITVCTALMEARQLAGNSAAAGHLAAAVATDVAWPPDDYAQAKLDELVTRHARYGDTSYNLEPNLKEGPGGLRDIQTIAWIARRVTGSAEPSDWIAAGLVRGREWQQLEQARDTLGRLRMGLHLVAGRVEERLLFDHQPTLAQMLGFRDQHRDNRAVEQMMQTYFRAALAVRRVLARFSARWRERPGSDALGREVEPGFIACEDRLSFADIRQLQDDPASPLRLFACWQRHPELRELGAATAAALDQAVSARGAGLAEDENARSVFLDILRGPRVAETLSRMHLHGVLGAYLPAFARVAGRMQYDLFHVYTVDQHTLNVIRNIDRMAAGEAPEFPQASDVFDSLDRPDLLYLAALFHDIAKGRGGDHSELGAGDAAAFCREHGLGAVDSDLVAWLVQQHLLLSITAQKSDITDPAVINRFAAAVADRQRLDMLYLLTMADIAGTAPGLWNTWKARLVADLHAAARLALRRGLEHPIHADERIAQCRNAALELLAEQGIDAARAEAIWADFPPVSFLRYRASLVAWLTSQVANARPDSLPVVAARSVGERGAREIFVHSPDVDGLFAAITAALDRLDLDVVEARIMTSAKGLSLDTFRALERSRREAGPERDEEIVRSLRYALRQRPLRLGPVKRSLSRGQRHFQISPQIDFAPVPSADRTSMSLVCSDRPGLLALIAQVLREQRVRVHGARIATFGERAEDFFLLSDEQNRPLDEASQARVDEALRNRLSER